jgi:hypothetical protein
MVLSVVICRSGSWLKQALGTLVGIGDHAVGAALRARSSVLSEIQPT